VNPAVVIVAFDGLIADSLALRADVVSVAMRAEGWSSSARLTSLVVGRDFREAIHDAVVHDGLHVDETALDVATMHARQLFSQRVADGLLLTPGATRWIERRAAAGTRLVLRADSARRDVQHVLEHAGIADAFMSIRCCDDPPRSDVSSIERSYAAVVARLAQHHGMSEISAVERDDRAATVARAFVRHAAALAVLDGV
jgi:beta-phosphoglucomutase-like phosphatase (HAD superfamily)